MKQRLITSVFGILICIAALFFGAIYPLVIVIAVGAVTMAMVFEFLTAESLIKDYRISLICLAFAISLPIMVNKTLSFLPIYLFTLLLFIVMIFNHNKFPFSRIAFAYSGTLIITLAMACISILSYEKFSIYYVVLCLGVPWMADSGAFFVGTFCGKHKLCPDISPKKTIEGALGGIAAGIIGAIITSLVFQFIIYRNVYINYFIIFILGFVMSVVSIIGDLAFSVIKRSCRIKDFGSIMPGHGGFCDRFDSVVFTAPLLMFAVRLFTFISVI